MVLTNNLKNAGIYLEYNCRYTLSKYKIVFLTLTYCEAKCSINFDALENMISTGMTNFPRNLS